MSRALKALLVFSACVFTCYFDIYKTLTETGKRMFSWTGNHWRVVLDSVVGSRQRKGTCLPVPDVWMNGVKTFILKFQVAFPKIVFVLTHFQQNTQSTGELYKHGYAYLQSLIQVRVFLCL